LSPAARARLSAAINGEAGADIPFRAIILEPLLAAQRALGEIPHRVAPEQLLLAPLDPFVTDEDVKTKTPGVVTRVMRDRLAQWLVTTGAPDIVKDLAA